MKVVFLMNLLSFSGIIRVGEIKLDGAKKSKNSLNQV